MDDVDDGAGRTLGEADPVTDCRDRVGGPPAGAAGNRLVVGADDEDVDGTSVDPADAAGEVRVRKRLVSRG